MPYVLIDTCVFTRLQGIFEDLLTCISEVSDVIAVTKEILDEYEGRAPSKLFVISFYQSLEKKDLVKFFNRSFLDSVLRRRQNPRKVNYPTHNPDRKWIDVAIAVKAKCVVSTNLHLLRAGPNSSNGDKIEMLEPSQYIETRCPNS
jgi:predicted nucleic acid-binding protein